MFSQIKRILEDGIKSLLYNIEGNKRPKGKIICIFVVILIVSFLVSLVLEKVNEIIDTLLTCLSIFTAFIFTALFVVPDKLSSRMNMLKEKDDDATHGYLTRFCNFTRMFVQQMSFVIVQSITLIILFVVQKLYPCFVLTFINSILFVTLIFYVLTILSNIYILLMDDIDRNEIK